MTEALVALGVIARPHGIRGSVRVHLFNPDSSVLEGVDEVFVRDASGKARRMVVKNARPVPKALLMDLEGCNSPEAAEALRGAAVCVPRDVLPPADEGEVYFFDLIGLEVRSAGTAIGKVLDVVEYPSADCLRVQLDTGIVEIPILPLWIEEVDVEAGTVSVHDLSDLPVEEAP